LNSLKDGICGRGLKAKLITLVVHLQYTMHLFATLITADVVSRDIMIVRRHIPVTGRDKHDSRFIIFFPLFKHMPLHGHFQIALRFLAHYRKLGLSFSDELYIGNITHSLRHLCFLNAVRDRTNNLILLRILIRLTLTVTVTVKVGA